MAVPSSEIERFRKLYLKEFGENLSHEEAAEKAHRFLRFVDVITRPPAASGDLLYGGSNRLPFDAGPPSAAR